MLLSHQILEFDYSLIASAALFLACKSGEYKLDEEKMIIYGKYLDVFNQKELESCLLSMKCIWTTLQTSTTYQNFDAIYNKYQVQYNFFGRTLTPPIYYNNDLQEWFNSQY